MIDVIIAGLQAGFGAAIIRNITGYLKKALEDGKLTKYELRMLCATAVTNVLYAVVYILLGLSPETAMGAAVLTDIGIGAVKDKKE